MIKAGDAKVVVAGGQESMSNVPYYLKTLRNGNKMGDAKLQDGMVYDGIWDYFGDVHMGVLGDFTAKEAGVTREEQDKWAAGSHAKARGRHQGGQVQGRDHAGQHPAAQGRPGGGRYRRGTARRYDL